MPANPFSRKADRNRPSSPLPRAAIIPNDDASLRARAEKRKQFDFASVPLTVRNQTSAGRYFEASFSKLVSRYPQHEVMIKQLLHGAHLDLGRRIVSYQTHQDCYYSIEEFVDFLNNSFQSKIKAVLTVADIDFQATRNFSAYYLEHYPGRTANRKRFGRLRTVVNRLKKKYESDSTVGIALTWAQSPASSDVPSESYSDDVFNQLVGACLTDIKFIINMMNQYPGDLYSMQESLATAEPHSVDKRIIKNELGKYNLTSAIVANARPSWPFYDSLDDAMLWCSTEWRNGLDENNKHLRSVYGRLISSRVPQEIKCNRTGQLKIIDLEVGKLAYLCQFFFTIKTLFPFLLFVQINTGWNLEVVLSLTTDLDSHLGEDLIDPEQYVLIYGTKKRSQNILYCRSNKVHPYSVYNILRFVADQLGKFEGSPHLNKGSLWQGVVSKNLWGKFGRVVAPIDLQNYSEASRSFVRRHGIQLDSRAKAPGIESRRLRTTWETKRREQGLDLGSLSPMMGHSSVDLTAAHYDSDAGATNLMNKKLRKLQNTWDNDFRNYGVRLSLSTTLAQLRSAISSSSEKGVLSKVSAELRIEEKEIITLLAPEGQTYIAACLDSKRPNWPLSERFISNGEKCVYFNRCCMCKQAVIFRESLPYVVRRVSDLENLKVQITTIEWSANYAEESAAWESILEQWRPEKDVHEAKAFSSREEYALPLTMRGIR